MVPVQPGSEQILQPRDHLPQHDVDVYAESPKYTEKFKANPQVFYIFLPVNQICVENTSKG